MGYHHGKPTIATIKATVGNCSGGTKLREVLDVMISGIKREEPSERYAMKYNSHLEEVLQAQGIPYSSAYFSRKLISSALLITAQNTKVRVPGNERESARELINRDRPKGLTSYINTRSWCAHLSTVEWIPHHE